MNASDRGGQRPGKEDDLRFRVLVDSVRDYAIYMLDPDGVVVSWNSGAARIKGYAAEEVIGRHFSVFYSPEDVAAERPALELRVAAETGRYEEDGWRVRKDGTRFRAHVVVNALRDDTGALTGFAKVTQDVTLRWQAEQALRESEERFRILVEQIRDYAIFMLDAEGRVTTWNLGAHRIKGYQSHEVLGHQISMFYTPEDLAAGKLQRLLEVAKQTGVAHDTGWRLRKDGTRFWADVTLTALHTRGGEHYGFTKVVRDLTEQVQAEAQARAYEAAREAIRMRDDFLSIAAHELRTPLTAAQLQMQGVLRLLERDPSEWKHERIVTGVRSAIRSGRRLSELVETLLDVSRIAANRIRLKLSEFNLTELCREAIARLEGMLEQASCTVQFTAPPTLVGRWDRLRIEQALMNLISNACKYAPHSTVDVTLSLEGDQVSIVVKDAGPGIAPENLERIFERFERAASSTHYGGLGLGLYVTRQIAEVHGGRIEAQSVVGEGSEFRLTLPRYTPEPTSADG